MSISKFALGAAILAATMGSAAPASAALVSKVFAIQDGAITVATGSFSYDSSAVGVLGYGNLSSFEITGTNSYDLAFVDSLGSGSYVYFGYDTSTNTFVPAAVSGSVGPYDSVLAGANAALTEGFFFDPLPSQSDPVGNGHNDGEYTFYDTGPFAADYTSVTIEAVPEPATWTLALVGFGIVGTTVRSRRHKLAVTYG